MKTCPFCAEQIQDAAIKCRYCHSEVPVAPATPAPSPETRLSDHDDRSTLAGWATTEGLPLWGWAVGLMLIALVAIVYSQRPHSSTRGVRGVPTDPSVNALPGEKSADTKTDRAGSGTWERFNFTWTSGIEGTSATFKPFLPRDDRTVLGAIHEVIAKVHGDVVDTRTARIAGGGWLELSGNRRYHVMLVKEDTGEVHSFVIKPQ